MDIICECKEYQNKGESIHIVLPRRSLLVLSGPIRYGFTQAIQPRKTDTIDYKLIARTITRVSMTYRETRNPAKCYCNFPELCDSQLALAKRPKRFPPKKPKI